MSERININELEPKAYTAMFGLEGYLGEIELESTLKELIKIRASQVNGCAFCINMHTEQARKQGETEQRIYALSAWRESSLFSDEERAVLGLTDAITRIADNGVPDAIYTAAEEALGSNQLAQCIMQIATINAWNRMAVSTNMK